MNGQRYADDLEGQNDEALDGLSAKVKLLKDVNYHWYWERSTRVDNTAHPDERCLRGDGRYSFRDISKNEQHGYAARLSLAMVHRVFRHCLLVLHGCMVVSKMTLALSSLFLFPLYTSYSALAILHVPKLYRTSHSKKIMGVFTKKNRKIGKARKI